MADIEEILDAYKKKINAISRKSVYTMDSDPADEKEAIYEMAVEAAQSILQEEMEDNPTLMALALSEGQESLLENICTSILLISKTEKDSASAYLICAAIEADMEDLINEDCRQRAEQLVQEC